jgi:hypothetical protein
MFTRAATDFNRMYAAALDAGFELQVIGDYRTLARMKQLFFDRYQLEPSGRVPKVTRRYQGKTWYLKKGKSPCAAPPEGTPPNQTGGSMHGYGVTPLPTTSTGKANPHCRTGNQTPNGNHGT